MPATAEERPVGSAHASEHIVMDNGTIVCIFCNSFVGFKNNNSAQYYSHLKLKHNIEFHSKLLLVLNLTEKENLPAIVEMFGTADLDEGTNKDTDRKQQDNYSFDYESKKCQCFDSLPNWSEVIHM